MFRDPVSAASHWLMAFLSVTVGLYLLRLTYPDVKRSVFIGIFALCSTLVYSASGIFHAITMTESRFSVFQKIDMSAIYLMIAGSCTPIIGILVRGLFRDLLLLAQWLFVVAGIVLLWSLDRPIYPLMVAVYLGMGFVGCLGSWHFWKATGWPGISWALGGVVWYVLGAVVELLDRPVPWPGVVGSHELFHLLVMMGTVFHVVFLVKYVIPYYPVPCQPREAISSPTGHPAHTQADAHPAHAHSYIRPGQTSTSTPRMPTPSRAFLN